MADPTRCVTSFEVHVFDYDHKLSRRYHEDNPHRHLQAQFTREIDRYSGILKSFLSFSNELGEIPLEIADENSLFPYWRNGFLPGLDVVTLYGMLGTLRPKRYVEIGSGNSTKVVAKARRDLGLSTQITSIDPFPRASIDELCDETIRLPLEACELDWSNILGPGDILFFDGSHRLLQDSDVTVFFLEVLPALSDGVVVQIHDITLPVDYPADWKDRLYSEQYALATALLLAPEKFEILLPNHFVSFEPALQEQLQSLWAQIGVDSIEKHGGSFWFRWRPGGPAVQRDC